MSERIQHIMGVIKEVDLNYLPKFRDSKVRDLRIEASKKIANQSKVTVETVRDKFGRQLKPDIDGVNDFDRLLLDWVRNKSRKLAKILIQHSVSRNDVTMINDYFTKDSLSAPDLIYDNRAAEEDGDKQSKSYYEGDKISVLVRKYERERKAREKCIDFHGTKCSVCEFDFGYTYGNIAENFIHVHHVIPLSSIGENYQVNPYNDLKPVCPNCHAVIHMNKPPYTIEEVRGMIDKSNS